MATKPERAELVYPHGVFNPLDWLRFMELRPFSRRRKELGLTDDDMRIIQIAIMVSPTGAPVIPGTGGLRKLRCHRPDSNKGKRGGIRVCYVHFAASGIVAFVTAFAKGDTDNLTAAERKAFKTMIEFVERGLSDGSGRPRL